MGKEGGQIGIGWIVGWTLPVSVHRAALDHPFIKEYNLQVPDVNPRRALLSAVQDLDAAVARSGLRCKIVKPPTRVHHDWVLLVQQVDPQNPRRVVLELRALLSVRNGVLSFSEYQGSTDLRPIVRKLQAFYAERAGSVYLADVSGQIVRLIKGRFYGVHTSRQGGTYFVPASGGADAFVESLRSFVLSLPHGDVYTFVVTGHQHERDAVLRMFTRYIEEFVSECERRLSKNVRPETADAFGRELTNALASLEIYRQILQASNERLDEAEAAIQRLILKLAEG